MASLRSSTRTTPRKRYTVDAFDGIQDLIQYSSASSDRDEQREQIQYDKDEDDEDAFQAGRAQSESDDEAMSGLEDQARLEELDDRASDAGEADLDDTMSIDEDDGPITKTPRGTIKRRPTRRKQILPPKDERTYVRGVPNDLRSKTNNKIQTHKWLFGPTKEDQAPVMKARNRWSNKLGMPSRKSTRPGYGGFLYNEAYCKEIERAESNWSWYWGDGGREAFDQRQVIKPLTLAEAQLYLPTDFASRAFVMGDVDKRKMFNMTARQWVSVSATSTSQAQTLEEDGGQKAPGKKGFILNLGARVQSLEWAPCQDGPKQYLAITVVPKSRADYQSFEAPRAPSFTPQSPHRSSIQIWEFSSSDSDNYINETIPPKLKLVLCTEIGEIKSMKWCPVPRKLKDRLGLLACVSGDGFIRIFDVPRPSNDSHNTNILIEKAAFQCKPPDTVCTSLAWISSSRIAAACANGFVAVWDVAKSMESEKENPRPTIYTTISTTYIVSIVSCWPSFPNLIAATSMSGYTMLTDLSQPHPSSYAATALSPRARLGLPLLAWHDFANCAMSIEDNQTIRCFLMRRWFRGVGTGKVKGHGTSIAVSPCHPFVLLGSASGEVTGQNPIRRLVDGGKTPLISQRWFAHEWRRPTEDEVQAAEMADAEAGNEGSSTVNNVQSIIGKDGLSRITEGFKTHTAALNTMSHSIAAQNVKDGTLFSTIYEEKSAVTVLAWNPNIHVGGWAAAGMADGLLKVEDIAV